MVRPQEHAGPADPPDTGGPAQFAGLWTAALTGTGYVALTNAEIHTRLLRCTEQLLAALRTDGGHDDNRSAAQVGEELVRMRFGTDTSLGASLRLLGEQLLTCVGAAEAADAAVRLPGVLAAFATGFAAARQRDLLHQQDLMRRAALRDRDKAQAGLRESEARFRAVFTQSGVGIAVVGTDNRLTEGNTALADMLGYPLEELDGIELTRLHDPQEPAAERPRPYRELMSGGREHYQMERRLRRKDGTMLWTNVTATTVRDAAGTPQLIVAVIEDITERREFEQRLRHQATHDPLTGLPNRALFAERLAAVFDPVTDEHRDPAARVAVCYLDLDGFKVINDSLGHDVGDRLLVAVAARLAEVVADTALLARMGGDEFVVLIERTSGVAAVIERAREILRKLAEPVRIGGHRLSVSVSIGIVERGVAETTAAELMRDADVTLYWAKADGRGTWACYDRERNAREVARFTLAARMPAALEREEFVVEYQPLVRLVDGALTGVEALVRWEHPEFGRLGPDRFIELAEETGLIVPLGLWVLNTACHAVRSWRDRYGAAAPMVSVNLSARQTTESTFVSDVAMILDAASVPGSAVQLELTETAIMATTGAPLEVLRSLAAMDIRIAIDDFGTGYSNLAYLRHLPVHGIKLAGTFMAGMDGDGDPVDEHLVRTLVSLAHTLHLDVTAEGVETAQQARRLREIGCESAQGWLYSRPVPPEEIDRLIERDES